MKFQFTVVTVPSWGFGVRENQKERETHTDTVEADSQRRANELVREWAYRLVAEPRGERTVQQRNWVSAVATPLTA